MAFPDLQITEIFHSLQGETSLTGERFSFIRLTGCNLRCTYCDSAYAFHGGKRMSIPEILDTVKPHETKHVLLTGGEPLLQRNTKELARALVSQGYAVSIETHGEVSIEAIAPFARVIMDIKTPSSAMSRGEFVNNFKFLKPSDEIKFVIASQNDYFWARDVISSTDYPNSLLTLFSPVQPAKMAPGKFPGVELKWLAEKIIEDKLSVRLQTQLHKAIWGSDVTGV
ncbi:MAG: radical SAM protein [Xanthomonadaceae bacterium]|nr:radical SAM protein [Xanthomonadaceae bacterium]